MLEHITEGALVDLGSEVLQIPSFKGDETKLAGWLADYFERRNYDVDLQEVAEGRRQVIARLPGRGSGPRLMFNGHLDIDPLRSGWRRDPFQPVAEDGLLYGAGARNMKAGLTSMIIAAEAIRKTHGALEGDLVLACVAGELQGGVGTTYALRNGLHADAAIVPEPFGAHNLVTTTCGVLEFAVSTFGFSEHISRKENAVDALSAMIPIINALNDIEFNYAPHPDLPDLPRLVVGGIVAGRGPAYDLSGPNYTPDTCTITVDVRYVPGQTSDSVIADVRAAIEDVRRERPELEYEISFESRPPYVLNEVVFEPSELPERAQIVDLLEHSHRELAGSPVDGIGAVLPHSYCGADSAHLQNAGIPSVLYGPTGPARTADDADDCAYLSEMELVARVLADTAVRFCGAR
ncbi:M20/M25/M40 family metallo-hydrolase [Nocardioidaceae bacterium SCSIO 66511]|nr:M20/M25/M40 family metallo-hydrolase [Nocardioidaceae bacterium SCSIO 66511]